MEAINEIASLKRRLETAYANHLICKDETELVIEGFPRSGNTFVVDFIRYQLSQQEKDISLAHHTHSPLNIRLAALLNKPCLILCREPRDAIISFVIYTNRPVLKIANEYIEFHKKVLEFDQSQFCFASFKDAVSNINKILVELNKRYGFSIPLTVDMKGDAERVRTIDVERAKRTRSEEEYVRTVGAPIRERDALKLAVAEGVDEFLRENDEVQRVYEAMANRFI